MPLVFGAFSCATVEQGTLSWRSHEELANRLIFETQHVGEGHRRESPVRRCDGELVTSPSCRAGGGFQSVVPRPAASASVGTRQKYTFSGPDSDLPNHKL